MMDGAEDAVLSLVAEAYYPSIHTPNAHPQASLSLLGMEDGRENNVG